MTLVVLGNHVCVFSFMFSGMELSLIDMVCYCVEQYWYGISFCNTHAILLQLSQLSLVVKETINVGKEQSFWGISPILLLLQL